MAIGIFKGSIRSFPGAERLPGAEDLPLGDLVAIRLKRVTQDWYHDHPLCGAVLGCNDPCPYYRPEREVKGILFPHCGHPKIGDPRYRP